MTFFIILSVSIAGCSGTNQSERTYPTTTTLSLVTKSPESKTIYSWSDPKGKGSIEIARIIKDEYEWSSGGDLQVKGIVQSSMDRPMQARVVVTIYDTTGVKIDDNYRIVDLDANGQTAFWMAFFNVKDYRQKGLVYRIDLIGK